MLFVDSIQKVEVEEEGGDHAGHSHRRRQVKLFNLADLTWLLSQVRDVAQDECPDSDDIFENHDEDDNGRLDENELEEAMLDMILYILDGCQTQETEDESPTDSDCEEPSDAEAWGYALLSSVIISLIAFIGILIIPLDKATKHKRKVSRNFFHE